MSSAIAQTLWAAHVPLHITHPSSPGTPFITSVPRFSYLALLLPRLSAFFRRPCSSFHSEGVQLRNLAVGLLADLYRPRGDRPASGSDGNGAAPWRLVVADGVSWDIADTFLNSVKEADFVRNGNANQIMKMSKEHTTQLWHAVVDNDFAAYSRVHARLLDAPTALKHVPLRVYIPSSSSSSSSIPSPGPMPAAAAYTAGPEPAGAFRVVQTLVPAVHRAAGEPRLLGEALRDAMPLLFPSSRGPVMADVLLHGVPAPFDAPLAEIMREAAYPDGWLCLVVVVK
ncbi:Autophagy protein 5 [Escovopsis weberi]|uniref:Autophagy protein 5 n=1 Tax=Escovopsis weberi TaxID=150374 RepID=A0A0M8N554_ESCWE|nr:Autophagy protein 5 [Escovopsis weberi]